MRFTTELGAEANLLREGIDAARIRFVRGPDRWLLGRRPAMPWSDKDG